MIYGPDSDVGEPLRLHKVGSYWGRVEPSMKCYQCDRPAFFGVTDKAIPLCLDCCEKLKRIQHIEFLQHAAMLNQAMDDMDAVAPFGITGGRIPVAALAKAVQKAVVLNNIKIDNSQIGVLNNGEIAKIDAAITLTRGSDVEPLGDKLAQFTQAVLDAQDLSASQRKELLDLLQTLTDQIVRERKPAVVSALSGSILAKAGAVASLSASCAELAAALKDLFT